MSSDVRGLASSRESRRDSRRRASNGWSKAWAKECCCICSVFGCHKSPRWPGFGPAEGGETVAAGFGSEIGSCGLLGVPDAEDAAFSDEVNSRITKPG